MVAAGFVVILFMAGCSNNASTSAPSRVPARPPAADAPSLAYLTIASNFDPNLQRQVGVLIRNCMEKLGYKYYPTPPSTLPAGLNTQERDQPDRKFVLAFGYGVSRGPADSGTGTQNGSESKPSRQGEYIDKLLSTNRSEFAEYWLALKGLTLGGTEPPQEDNCENRAYQRVFGRIPQVNDEFQRLVNDIEPRVAADVRVLAAQAKWSACLARKGYEFRTRADAKSSVHKQYNAKFETELKDPEVLGQFQKAERELAIADYDCYVKHLQGVTRATRRDLENQLLEDNPEVAVVVNAIKTSLKDAMNATK